MNKFISNKLEKQKELKKNRKLWISRSKNKSSFKEGVLNLSKKFVKEFKKSS